jgi:hypothetical protein
MRRRSYTAARLAGIPAPTPAVAQPVSPLGQALQTTCEAIARHEIEPCPVCGRFDCDHRRMGRTDVHRPDYYRTDSLRDTT